MPLYLPRNLAALARVAERPDCNARYAVDAIRVLDPGDGTYRLEATDGKRLAIVRGQSADACYPALEATPDGAREVLIPAADWAQAFRMGPKGQPVGLAAGDGVFTFAVGTQAFTGTPPQGRYPDVEAVLPQGPPVVRFRLHPGLLAGLSDLASALGLPEGNSVEILYYGQGKPVGLIGHNDRGQFLDCLVMPLT